MPGVGQIQNYGTADYAMRIWIKPERLASLGLTVPDLLNAVKQQSTVNPAGGIGTEPAPKGQEFTYTVRSQGRLVSSEEFGNVVVRLNPDGSVVRLKDVSRIELGALNYQQRARLNGKPSCPIGIFQVPGSNAIAVAEGVKKTMMELKERFPDDLDYVVSLDTTLPVTEGIKEIEHTLFEAIVLVIIVVFLFLQGWRATLIPLLAVPVSLIGTFMFFPSLGFSINTLSLFGLVLAIGLVVDDAIVVVEAVEHHIEHGLSPEDATLKAMEEVTQPVIGIALVLSAVFIPVAFMGGIQGRMNMQFAITIAVSVLISAFNALSLSPALCSLILKPKKQSKGPLGKFFAWFNQVFNKMTKGYVNLSRHLVRRMVVSLLILGGFVVLSGLLGKRLPSGFLPNEDQGYFFLNVQLPDASSLQRTDAVCQKIEKLLQDKNGAEGRQVRHDGRRLPPPRRSLGSLYGLLLHRARSLGRAQGRRDAGELDRPPLERGVPLQDPGSERRRFRAARHPGPRHRRRLLVLAPGPERRNRPVPGAEPPEVPGGRAEASRARQRQQRLAGRGAADLRRHQPRQGPEAGRRRSATSTSRSRRSWAASTSTSSTASAASGRSSSRPSRSGRVKTEDINQFYVRNNDGKMTPLSAVVTTRSVIRARSSPTDSTSSGRRRSPASRARLQLRTGHGGPRGGLPRDHAARDGLRLGRHVVPGGQGGRRRRPGLRPLDHLRLPDPRRALRELVAALRRSALGARSRSSARSSGCSCGSSTSTCTARSVSSC